MFKIYSNIIENLADVNEILILGRVLTSTQIQGLY